MQAGTILKQESGLNVCLGAKYGCRYQQCTVLYIRRCQYARVQQGVGHRLGSLIICHIARRHIEVKLRLGSSQPHQAIHMMLPHGAAMRCV